MYKCSNDNCRYIIEDGKIAFSDSPKVNYIAQRGICPLCEGKIIYINELQLKSDKYKNNMKISMIPKK